MRLIEKKCPNCGANLEFDENDKSCKCTYCKRSFEIERDTDNLDKFNLIYDKMQKPVKTFMMIPFIFAFVIIVIIAISIFTQFRRTGTEKTSDFGGSSDVVEKKDAFIQDASELTNENLDTLDHKCYSVVHQSVTGRSDTTYSYQITGEPRVKNVYVAAKEDSNYIISIYEVIYHNFFNQSDQQTVYVPVVFENVKNSVSIALTSGKNPSPEYYLNADHSTYIYAYGSFEDAYNGVVKTLEGEYTISEK